MTRRALALRVVAMLGDFLREAGALVLVFGILEPLMGEGLSAEWAAGVVLIGLAALASGIGLALLALYSEPERD